MSGDINDAGKIALCIVLVMAIMAIVLALMQLATKEVDSSSTQMQKTSSKVQESEFDAYNQTERTGTDVLAAVRAFEGRPVAICVQTLANRDYGDSIVFCYNALLQNVVNYDGDDASHKIWAANFHETDEGHEGSLELQQDKGYCTALLKRDSTTREPVYSNDYSFMTTKGKASYVNPSGTFKSWVVKDYNDYIIGIVFKQIS